MIKKRVYDVAFKKMAKHYAGLKVIILTMHAKAAFLKHALTAGARGYLLKNGYINELFDAIKKVNDGELVIGADENS